MRKILFLAFILLSAQAFGARIYGTVYDSSLMPVRGSVVTVNTTPEQRQIALNGTYGFDVSRGTYTVNAQKGAATASDDISVDSGGDFRIDLVTLEPFESGDVDSISEALTQPDVFSSAFAPRDVLYAEVDDAAVSASPLFPFALGFAFAALVIGVYLFHRLERESAQRKDRPPAAKAIEDAIDNTLGDAVDGPQQPQARGPEMAPQKPLSKDQERMLSVIRGFGNRLSQKELRKALPEWSEAKVSMELTELEDFGAVAKIKKGRGNVIRIR